MRLALIVAAAFALNVFASAANKDLHDHNNVCTVSVPDDWSVTPMVGSASSPDQKVRITVSSPSHGMNSLAQVEQTAPTVYKDDKITKKSGSEFEMEGKSVLGGKPNFYRAVPAGAKVCIAEITYENDKSADAKAIVETLHGAK